MLGINISSFLYEEVWMKMDDLDENNYTSVA